MATLRTRLDRLEGKRGAACAGPSVIYLCDAETGEPGAALMTGGDSSTREAGEGAEAFTARATAGASLAFRLPDNGR
jgi:hypothetical protein